jgi:hypothetical protein
VFNFKEQGFMSYDDKAGRQTFTFPATTIGGADVQYPIQPPAGRRARVIAVNAAVTTVIVGSPTVRVGRTGALARYASLSLGSNAAALSAFATEQLVRPAATGIPDLPAVDETLLVSVGTGTSGVVVPSVTVDFY